MGSDGFYKNIPIDMRALMSEVGNRTGHHFYFKRSLTNTGSDWSYGDLIPPRIPGETVRIFGYAPVDIGGSLLVAIHYNDDHCTVSHIDKDGVYKNTLGGEDTKQVTVIPEPKIKVNAGTFVSLAVRIETLTLLTAYFNRDPKRSERQATVEDERFRAYFWTDKYNLFSAHLTCETETSATLWRYDSRFVESHLSVHAIVIYTIRAYEDDPNEFYIKIGEQTVDFNMGKGKVKAGQQFTYIIRRFQDRFIINVDFHPTKKHTVLIPYEDYQVLDSSFHEKVNIMRVEGCVPYNTYAEG